jgi:hypothetical protein
MAIDDATRRQLRFSLFLQGAAGLMFLTAFVFQIIAGNALMAVIFGLIAGAVGVAFTFTRRKFRSL